MKILTLLLMQLQPTPYTFPQYYPPAPYVQPQFYAPGYYYPPPPPVNTPRSTAVFVPSEPQCYGCPPYDVQYLPFAPRPQDVVVPDMVGETLRRALGR